MILPLIILGICIVLLSIRIYQNYKAHTMKEFLKSILPQSIIVIAAAVALVMFNKIRL
jgi:hypothetical protein